jgi:hypothetical protein
VGRKGLPWAGVHVLSPPSTAHDDNPASAVVRRGRTVGPAEQAQRKAWGAKWGKLVADAARQHREGKET